MNQSTHEVRAALLPFLGVLRLQGPDAAQFLQGQVTQDTRLLAAGRTLLTACNTPQGRVIALLRLKQTEDAVYALLPTDLLEPVASRLKRFVLRAKVDVQTAADLQVAWLGSQPFSDTLAIDCSDAARVLSVMPEAGATGLVSFDYTAGRRVVAAPGASLRAITALSSRESLPEIEREWWAADIAAGLPQVFRASSEAFVPQMLNLDLLDGISFTKGCYTGQEIVARTQNLGRIKRRTFRYHVTGGTPLAPLAGLSLDGTKVAEVVMSAPHGSIVELLAVTSLDARDRTLITEDGREAVPAGIPYGV
jgi:folate-binding protein YgfZ